MRKEELARPGGPKSKRKRRTGLKARRSEWGCIGVPALFIPLKQVTRSAEDGLRARQQPGGAAQGAAGPFNMSMKPRNVASLRSDVMWRRDA
jgi:hypothetical protein